MKMFLPQKSILRQYLILITVNLSNLSVGFGLGWMSPVLIKLKNNTDLVLSRAITEDEGSWLASLIFLPIVFCAYPAACLANRLGRKITLITSTVPLVIACFLFLFATEIWMILLGRFLIGVSASFLFSITPTYAAEIASKEIRGALGTLFQISCALGIFLSFCIGPFVSYLKLNLIYTAITVTLAVPLVFLPESPYLLYSTGKTEESRKVLTYLRQSKSEVDDEMLEYTLQIQNKTKFVLKELFKNKVLMKTFAIVIILAIGSQLSGFNLVQAYLQSILESTNTSIRPEIASVVIGFLQLLASFCTSIVTDKFGRKPIMITTLIGMSLGLIFLGVFFKLKDLGYQITGILNALPLVSITLVVFGYSAGIGSIFYTLIAELFEGPTRAIGVSVALQISSLCIFITSRYFVYVVSVIGAATTYWLFSGSCLLTSLFVASYVPETKGMSFGKIQEELGARRNLVKANI